MTTREEADVARDDFKTQDPSEYSIDDVWRGSADKQGHSAYVRVPVPKHWSGQMIAIVQSGDFDYKSQQDFVRDAIYHRLHWAGSVMRDGKFLARLGVDKLQAHLEHYMVEAEGFKEFTTRLDEAAAMAQNAGDSREFATLIDVMRDEADATLREPFRTEAMAKLQAMYELFLARASVAKAGDDIRNIQEAG